MVALLWFIQTGITLGENEIQQKKLMQDRKKMAYFCCYHFFILKTISEYSEFQNYLQNKEMTKTEVSLLFPILC